MKQLLFETDWLASHPVFYNERTGRASLNINDVIDSDHAEFHAEGFYNFLDYGYSVFGQTPIDKVRFLPHAAALWMGNKALKMTESSGDPFDSWIDYRISEDDIIELIRSRVQEWERRLPDGQQIVLPLSGGFDSRLLLWCIENKSRIFAYTYGLSNDQSHSTEVVHAQTLAKRFKIRWQRIELCDFHRYFDDWNDLFGISTHAHGMYHFEFYTKIRKQLQGRHAFLSGIFGDVWAGSILPRQIDNATDLIKLGYTHGLRADPQCLSVSVEHDLREHFWMKNRKRLCDHRFQIVTTVRLKLMLISYLLRVPRLFDFDTWSPYLDIDVAMAMLNLPQKRRINRQWQQDFFRKVGLDLESMGIASNPQNTLNHQAMRSLPLRPLDQNLLARVVDPHYVNWVNKHARMTRISDLNRMLQRVPKVGGILRHLGIRDRTLEAYCAYLCLWPVEHLLRKKIKTQGHIS